jgi:peptidoglycan/LPS O-acetylase OafA/YrhL
MKNNGDKLIGLELVRFIAAFAILIWHYKHFTYFENKPVDFFLELQPFFSKLSFFYIYGLYGVQIFWCVSGFIFFWKYKDLIVRKEISGREFFLLRFSRLYPLHFITLLIVAALQILYFKINGVFFVYQFNDLYHFLLQVFFISDWGFGSGFSFNGVIWSISIEVLIYLFFFISLKYIVKSRSLKAHFLIIILSLIIFYTENIQNILNYSLVVECLCLFYAGGIAATFYRKFKDNKNAMTLSFVFFIATPILINFFEIYNNDRWLNVFLLFYTPLGLFLFAQIKISDVRITRILKILGNLTYSSYLIHVPLQLIIILILFYMDIAIPIYNVYFFIFYLITILLLSRITFCYFEKPIQDKIRKHFLS